MAVVAWMMDECMRRWLAGWMGRCLDGRVGCLVDGWKGGRVGGQMVGWMVGWMDGSAGQWMNQFTAFSTVFQFIR